MASANPSALSNAESEIHHTKATCDRQQSTISSSSSSALTNSSSSPSSSLTSISTSSPTASNSISDSHSAPSVSISSSSYTNAAATTASHSLAAIGSRIKPTTVLQSNVHQNQLSTSVRSEETKAFFEQSHEPCSILELHTAVPAENFAEDCQPMESVKEVTLQNDICARDNMVEDTREMHKTAIIAESNRMERSNSFSQAEASAAQLAAAAVAAANAHNVGALGASSLSHDNLAAASSLSQQSIPTIVGDCLERCSTRDQLVKNRESSSTNIGNIAQSSNDCANALLGANANINSSLHNQALSFATSSSRFFSSKLNTGSLWSLLSVGSNSSTNTNDMTNADNLDQSSSNDRTDPSNVADNSVQNKQNQSDSMQLGNLFSRVQFKRASAQQQPTVISKTSLDTNNQSTSESLVTNRVEQTSNERKRFRTNVKYFGSQMLHKNFTLPMLEWIAKDIKRQTVKGAQTISQRQYTIPARDIFLEIQSYQITALSCRDGHCIFVHPMHCVSKYAQLQHDPTCFAYLIRETKDSPLFCHVFQAKSANKVHDIFSAVREATTRSQPTPGLNDSSQQIQYDQGSATNLSNTKVQKSASSDTVFGSQSDQRQLAMLTTPSYVKSHQTSLKPSIKQGQAQTQHPSHQDQANSQFENSYQFEVMLVKKVKVQRRRVPATFVDDALETLKSFEVLKGGESKSQIKGVGKRIISASVDERQEYDEACQSPTPSKSNQMPHLAPQQHIVQALQNATAQTTTDLENPRRGSSVSLHKADQGIKEERESRSCQQSPTKVANVSSSNQSSDFPRFDDDGTEMKKHLSMDCLHRHDDTTPTYSNDFSPYNTITSTDLNERIAAIPVVSSSVSLDHETRQKLARQVRETIMATAANIKKGVYASGDKLNATASSKALDSLSCTVTSDIASDLEEQDLIDVDEKVAQRQSKGPILDSQSSSDTCWSTNSEARRSSANACCSTSNQISNNFDLFRRASARQVVRNRTVLLLIGKDELCTISIDQHQMLFSKSFSSIVHCLQGNNNKDHFGLICRDSGKINPNAESYAGFIFKCQSEKVVREIMGALKQVIYFSQHNYHGYNSPYNPMNTLSTGQYKSQQSPKLERASVSDSQVPLSKKDNGQSLSLAAKRGFTNPIEIESSVSQLSTDITNASPHGLLYQRTNPTPPSSTTQISTIIPSQPKNLIKSMFCDNCPLYWYHRLCCDIESLPSEASKSIILRRIDSSMTEKEQDELYSKFSEFNIDSISEHNEIFMSLLRHLCEKKQFKHVQSNLHLSAMAKNTAQTKKPATAVTSMSRQSSLQSGSNLLSTLSSGSTYSQNKSIGHQRSGSSSGSLVLVLGQTNANQASQSISDASFAAMDNFKKAKNTISSSIENILKRRSSMRDEIQDESDQTSINLPSRAGSFRAASRESRSDEPNKDRIESGGNLKRSQSTSEYSNDSCGQSATSVPSWKGSLSRTINDDLANSFNGFFRRRNSGQGSKLEESCSGDGATAANNQPSDAQDTVIPVKQQGSPNLSEHFRFMYPNHQAKVISGQSTPSSMLSSVFWKKSIFDKIRQPIPTDEGKTSQSGKLSDTQISQSSEIVSTTSSNGSTSDRRRTKEELRLLWRKAIIEQITLIKMDRQNQKLVADNVECDIQRVKLNYRDVLYSRDVSALWDKLLRQDPTQKVEFAEVARLVKKGVPKQRRGEIWMFLMNQYQLRHGTSFQPADSEFHGDANQVYRDLLSQLSTQQHEIFVDIGRTFPSHPYYSQYLSIGQLSLFNLLKAYSLLDPEVGYCQGLSFVAGILLLHVDSEDEAFELMRHLLFDFGLRKQYLPSMNALHLQLYQLTRLLRDHEYNLFNHFDRHDISPSLYAAPWFLTLFASQFPLGFVSRLIDLISLIGIEAIFRVSLNLLAFHQEAILKCRNLESTMEFMRTDLVKIDDKNLVKIFDKSMSLDLRNKLIEYEIEYTFYCAEDRAKQSNRDNRQISSTKPSAENSPKAIADDVEKIEKYGNDSETTSVVADATATVIIQHLLANNHLKSLRSNYSY